MGAYIFLRDVRSGDVWSAGYQPSGAEPDSYEVVFSEDRAEITANDGSVTTMLEVLVSPEDDAEVRRVSITNHGVRAREIEITSFAEVALHGNLTTCHTPLSPSCLLRPNSPPLKALFSRRAGDARTTIRRYGPPSCRGRRRKLRRCAIRDRPGAVRGPRQTIRSPAAIADGWPLSNTAGPVLDPIFSLRRRCRFRAARRCASRFWTMAADSRDGIVDLIDKASRRPRRSSALPLSPGPRRRCSCVIWASVPTKRTFSSAWPITFSISTTRCAACRCHPAWHAQGIDFVGARHFRRLPHRSGPRPGR